MAIAASRALLACSDGVILAWSGEVLAAIERWLGEPQTRESLEALGNYWWSHTREHPESDDPAARAICWTMMQAQRLSSHDPEGAGDPPSGEVELREWCREWADDRVLVGNVLANAQEALGVGRTSLIEDAVRADVVPWLLGTGDPVAARVLARWTGQFARTGSMAGRESRQPSAKRIQSSAQERESSAPPPRRRCPPRATTSPSGSRAATAQTTPQEAG